MESPQSNSKPLPKSRSVLVSMLTLCDECLRFADVARHRLEQKFQIGAAFGANTISAAVYDRRLASIERAQEQAADDYVPGADELWPYFDQKSLKQMQSLFEASRPDSSILGATERSSENFLGMMAAAVVANIGAQRMHVALLKQLRFDVAKALEHADIRADTEKVLARSLPKNDKILALHHRLCHKRDSGESEMSIALEFTDGNRTLADTLLRGVRRHRKRMSTPET